MQLRRIGKGNTNRVGNLPYNEQGMDRRQFVRKSGIGAIAISLPYGLQAELITTDQDKPIKIGIIGTGDRGGGLIPIINEIDKLEVGACCDVLPFRLDAAMKKVEGNVMAYSDYRSLLEDKSLNAILIATPFSTHTNIALDALQTGKHIYCEKTLAKGFDGISKLYNASQGYDQIFQTGHQYHSSRLYSHVIDLVRSGKIGKVTTIVCKWNRNGNWRRPVPDPKLERAINWRMYREYSGGLVAELCSHQLDFTNWLLDETPEKVIGTGGIDYWKDGRETYDNVHLVYSYKSGVKASFTSLTSNASGGYQIKVMGDRGSILIGYDKAWFYPEGEFKKEIGNVDGVAGATTKWDQGKGIPIPLKHADPSKQALLDFRDSIITGVKPKSSALTGAQTAACVQMGLDAMYNEKMVYWNSDLGV